MSSQGTWRQSDFDRNGVKDYWTREVASFHFFCDAAGSKLELIDINFGHADLGGEYVQSLDAAPFAFAPRDKSGYQLLAMLFNQEGNPYRQDSDGDGNAYENEYRYGICAFPAKYNVTGIRTFIVNEAGVIYSKDTHGVPVLAWPGDDPTTRGWEVEE